MAAVEVGMVMLGVVCGVAIHLLLRMLRELGRMNAPQEVPPPVIQPAPISDALIVKLVERMMDVSLPATPVVAAEPEMRSDAEYEEPDDDWVGAQDWTDPFLGIERPLVGRLRPGQSIPGIGPVGNNQAVDEWREKGEGAFGEWAAETYMPEAADAPVSWVAPIDLGDGQGAIE